jgi:hypothetical protein
MKNLYTRSTLLAAVLCSAVVLTISCKKTISPEIENIPETSQIAQRFCGAEEALQMQLAADPSLKEKMKQVENFTQRIITQRGGTTTTTTMPATVTIPVVVNVVYNTAEQNLSDAQIQSQIDVLNEDFQRLNADAASTPDLFVPNAASLGVKFTLHSIVRKSSTITSWTTDNKVKSLKTGGITPTNATSMLNIWVCNLSGGMLGYAQYPGGSSATDGVVIQYNAFGRTGTLMTRYNKGRTATHEIGHWMNLRHIWGDATCGDDYVGDTPSHNAANTGVPSYPHYSTCTGTPVEMTMDYMDYTDDVAMNMFSIGQRDRARACFASGGPRYAYYIK